MRRTRRRQQHTRSPDSAPAHWQDSGRRAQRSASVRSACTTKGARPAHADTSALHSPGLSPATSRPQAPCALARACTRSVLAARAAAQLVPSAAVRGPRAHHHLCQKIRHRVVAAWRAMARGRQRAHALRRQEQQGQQVRGRARQQLRRQGVRPQSRPRAQQACDGGRERILRRAARGRSRAGASAPHMHIVAPPAATQRLRRCSRRRGAPRALRARRRPARARSRAAWPASRAAPLRPARRLRRGPPPAAPPLRAAPFARRRPRRGSGAATPACAALPQPCSDARGRRAQPHGAAQSWHSCRGSATGRRRERAWAAHSAAPGPAETPGASGARLSAASTAARAVGSRPSRSSASPRTTPSSTCARDRRRCEGCTMRAAPAAQRALHDAATADYGAVCQSGTCTAAALRPNRRHMARSSCMHARPQPRPHQVRQGHPAAHEVLERCQQHIRDGAAQRRVGVRARLARSLRHSACRHAYGLHRDRLAASRRLPAPLLLGIAQAARP